MGHRTVARRLARVQTLSARSVKAQVQKGALLQHKLDRASSVVEQPVLKIEAKPPPLTGNFAQYFSSVPRLQPLSFQRSVAPQQPHVVTVPRRKAARSKHRAKPGLKFDWAGYGSIDDLKTALGMNGRVRTVAETQVLVAIDTESERHGLIDHVVEIGITILNVRDILDVPPGDYLRNWTSKMSHHHLVLDFTRKPKQRMHSSLFGQSQFLSATDATSAFRSILRSCAVDPDSSPDQTGGACEVDAPSPALALVGQSIDGDVAALRGAGVRTDIRDPADVGVTFNRVFDTLSFTMLAKRLGAMMPSGRLGMVVRQLGVDPQYVDPTSNSVIGTHNASNDAAYTMMVLLLYVLKWDELAVLEPTRLAEAKPEMLETLEERLVSTARPSTQGRKQLDWPRSGIILAVALASGFGISHVARPVSLDNSATDAEDSDA